MTPVQLHSVMQAHSNCGLSAAGWVRNMIRYLAAVSAPGPTLFSARRPCHAWRRAPARQARWTSQSHPHPPPAGPWQCGTGRCPHQSLSCTAQMPRPTSMAPATYEYPMLTGMAFSPLTSGAGLAAHYCIGRRSSSAVHKCRCRAHRAGVCIQLAEA